MKWDFKCDVCGEVGEYVFPNVETADRIPPRHCKTVMRRLPAAPNFAVKGDFTAKNGYSKEAQS